MATVLAPALAIQAFLDGDGAPLRHLLHLPDSEALPAFTDDTCANGARAVQQLLGIPLALRTLRDQRVALQNAELICSEARTTRNHTHYLINEIAKRVQDEVEKHPGIVGLTQECRALRLLIEEQEGLVIHARDELRALNGTGAKRGWRELLLQRALPWKSREQHALEERLRQTSEAAWTEAVAAQADLQRAVSFAEEQIPVLRAALEMAHPAMVRGASELMEAEVELRAHTQALQRLQEAVQSHEERLALLTLESWSRPLFCKMHTKLMETIIARHLPPAPAELDEAGTYETGGDAGAFDNVAPHLGGGAGLTVGDIIHHQHELVERMAPAVLGSSWGVVPSSGSARRAPRLAQGLNREEHGAQ